MIGISVIFMCCLLTHIECAKILGIYASPGQSHYLEGAAVMRILAERGHQVTIISAIGEKDPPKNYKDIVLSELHVIREEIIKDFFAYNIHPYLQTYQYNKIFLPISNATLSHSKVKQVLATEKFDLIILEKFYNDALLCIPYRLNVPFILHSTIAASHWTNPHIGNPAPPSFVPDVFLPYTSDMTFLQRLDNTLMYTFNAILLKFLIFPIHNEIVLDNFPDAPDISEYYYKPSMILLNEDISLNEPAPKVPSMIDIGGIHIKEPKPLPKDLEIIIENAKNGVIYFSMGSVLKGSNIANNTLNILLNTFSKLNQTILWKLEHENLQNKPDNVVIRKWLPQNDILAHRNIKLFMTHGGIHSTQEAIYHGVPCLFTPIFGDQNSNAQRAIKAGFAEMIQFEEISEENLLSTFKLLLTNAKYVEAAKKRSNIMKDKIRSPREKLIFWVEYVLRHKGAEHLRNPALELSWYQYLLLDVIFFVLVSFILCLVLCKYLLKMLTHLLEFKNMKTKCD